jgi:hypothetical protein
MPKAQKKNQRKKRAVRTSFLDSSVFLKNAFGHPLQQSVIARSVGMTKRIACEYTFTEINNHASRFIDFYIILRGEDSVKNAMRVAAESFNDRFGKYVFMILSEMLTEAGEKTRALAELARVIQGYIDKCYDFVSEIEDAGLSCPLSNAAFSTEPGLSTYQSFLRFKESLRCEIDDPPRCLQDQFRETNKGVIDLIRTDTLVRDDGAKSLQAYLGRLRPHGNIAHARGLRYRCSRIGDMLIAMQCPVGATIVSFDGAFTEYGRVLGRTCEILPSLGELLKRESSKNAT